MEFIQANSLDIATVAAVIAALVSLVGNALNIDKRYRAIFALLISLVIVFLPPAWLTKVLTAVIIGLTASGVYTQVKPREYPLINSKSDSDNNSNSTSTTTSNNTSSSTNNNTTNGNNNTTIPNNYSNMYTGTSTTPSNGAKQPDDEWVNKV